MKWNDSVAILSGDVMMGLAMRLLEESAQHAPRPLDVISAFSTGLIDVCDGQALDMEFQERSTVSEDEYMEMITKKTAKLLEMSVAIGASIAGAPDHHVAALRAFALGIGVAFQMQDDILDLTGGDAFGKTPGGDVLEGKKTWLMLAAQRRATQVEHITLIGEFFANHGLPQDRIADVQSMCDELGVLNDARHLVEAHTTQAFHHLHSLASSDARHDLEFLARSLMQRTT
jgi:geranylgeranyl diphosphate synthase type II